MDVAALTHLVVGLLAPFVGDVSTSATQESNNNFYQHSKRLYEALYARFAQVTDNGKASQALQNFAEDPDEYQDVFKLRLLRILQTDSAFADTLRQIIETGPRQQLTVEEETEVRHLRMANTLAVGSQRISAGKYSTINDNQMNIHYVE